MTTEEALALVKAVLNQKNLSKVEELVFQNVWEGLSYSEIATQAGYDPGYIKNVSYKLWQSLSSALGEKVTKNNLQKLLKLYLRHQTSASKPTLATGAIAHPRQDWGEAIDVSVFYGRAEELATLEKWIVQERCRLIGLLGIGGIGKTALSVRIAERVQDKFEYVTRAIALARSTCQRPSNRANPIPL